MMTCYYCGEPATHCSGGLWLCEQCEKESLENAREFWRKQLERQVRYFVETAAVAPALLAIFKVLLDRIDDPFKEEITC